MGDLPRTLTDTRKMERVLGSHPRTEFDDGLKRFVDWHKAMREYENPSPLQRF